MVIEVGVVEVNPKRDRKWLKMVTENTPIFPSEIKVPNLTKKLSEMKV